MPFSNERFAATGQYRGYPVYQEKNGRPNQIYVPLVPHGALVPYERR